MKTVKLTNTLTSKIESTIDPSDRNDMPKVKSERPQMTALQSQGMMRDKELVEQYDTQKKLSLLYTRLKQNLEACREVKPDSIDNERNDRAIEYYEKMAMGIEQTTEDIKRSAEKQLKYIQDNLEKALSTQHRKLTFALDKIDNAKQRKTKVKKTKEEVKLEKQLQQLLIDFKKTNPDKDIEYYFPNYKLLLGSSAPPSQPPPPAQPAQPPEKEDEDEDERQEQEEEQEEEDFTSLTPWEKFLRANPSLKLYTQYHKAIEMGITPDIPEPEKPEPKRRTKIKTATETISRESLAKFLPSYG
jgi:hypothetical protein